MSISEKATALKQHIDGQPDSDMYQYYGWFMNLLDKAINNTLNAEEKGRLLTQLPKFKNGSIRANDKLDALINALKGVQAGGRKRTRRSRRTRRRRN